MARRLFIGIPLPEDISGEVVGLRVKLNVDCGRVRWTKEENLHVTVLFLGDVEDGQYGQLLSRLEDAFAHLHRLELTAAQVTPAPPHRTPTMLWLAFKPSVGFVAMCKAIRKAAKNIFEFKPAHNEPLPHVTLARFRDGIPVPCQKMAKSIEYRRTFVVDECVMYESELSSDGPTYYELRHFKLGAD